MAAEDFYTIQSAEDGPRLTISDILKAPSIVPRRILSTVNSKFIADKLLRHGPTASGGVVKYYQSNPLFSTTPSAVVGEFGEIPVSQNELGQLMLTQTVKRGLGLRISEEMANRNDIDAVNLQITQIANTFERDWDGYFMALALAAVPSTAVVAATAAWSDSLATTRKDIAEAIYAVTSATLPGTTDSYLGFQPDTIVLNLADIANMVGNDDTWKGWMGNVNDRSPAVTGKLPDPLFGLDVWGTYHIPQGEALVCQRGVMGFISDEIPLRSSPLVWHDDTGSWRCNTKRQSAMGVDQPYSMALITGIG